MNLLWLALAYFVLLVVSTVFLMGAGRKTEEEQKRDDYEQLEFLRKYKDWK